MKVLLIAADFPPVKSGEAAHSFYLALNLAKRGIDVHVLTSAIENIPNNQSFKVYPIMRKWSWMSLPRLASFMKDCAPDAVLLVYLAKMYSNHPMVTFAATISKRVLPSVPFVTQFENVGGFAGHFLYRVIRKGVTVTERLIGGGNNYTFGTLLRDSHRIIVLSDSHRVKLIKYFEELNQKCVLIPPPPIMALSRDKGDAARTRVRASLGVNSDEFLLVYYGYIYSGKGLETLLQAFRAVAGRRKGIRLAIVGGFVEHATCGNLNSEFSHYEEEIRNLPRFLGISDKVIWTGPCPSEDERGSLLLRAADACVLPFDEGVYLNNSSFAGAISHGIPIITTRGSLLESPFVHEENVLLCPPKDAESMAAAIEAVMDNAHLRQKLVEGAQILAQEWFSWDKAIDRTIQALGVAV